MYVDGDDRIHIDRIGYPSSSTVFKGFDHPGVFPLLLLHFLSPRLTKGAENSGTGFPSFPHCPFEKIIIFDRGVVEKLGSRFGPPSRRREDKSAGSGPLPGNRAGQSGCPVAQGYPGTIPAGWDGRSPPYMVRHAV